MKHRETRLWIARLALLFTFSTLSGEVGSRLFWAFKTGAPVVSLRSMLYTQYPQLLDTGAERAAATRAPRDFDVLILGGSTISVAHGTVGVELGAWLKQRLGRHVRIFNLAWSAHNSRDSMLKHRWLADQCFDLVVVYDGINDTRMNNAPPGMFREDYGHCHWYECANRLDRHPWVFQAALPYTLLYGSDRLLEETGLAWYVPKHVPTTGWSEYGRDVRTRLTLPQNLREILDTARARSERVVMQTFAYHIPPDYSLKAALAGKLDYPEPKVGLVELWGAPKNVRSALDLQNEAVRALAADYPEAVFVDQAKLIRPSGKTFLDCCHFTAAGCTEFTSHIAAALEQAGL